MPVQKIGDLGVDFLFIVRAENDMHRLSRAHLQGSCLWLLVVNNDRCARVQAEDHPGVLSLMK